jgi:hypothetical protein
MYTACSDRINACGEPAYLNVKENLMARLAPLFTAFASMLVTSSALAGPITQVTKLSPRYNSDVIEIEWAASVAGGCTMSATAVTNATAANSNELIAFLLSAFATGSEVEVIFGGGCDGGSNWIQTIRLIR